MVPITLSSHLVFIYTLSCLHMNLQVANFQRCECATTQTSLDPVFMRVDRIESSKEPEPVPSMSGLCNIAACILSPIANDPSSSTISHPSPSSTQELVFSVYLISTPVCQLLYCTTLLFKVLYCKIKNVLSFVFIFYVLYLCDRMLKLPHNCTHLTC